MTPYYLCTRTIICILSCTLILISAILNLLMHRNVDRNVFMSNVLRNKYYISSFLPGCLYRGQECRLVIHYEQGFSVLADPKLTDGENEEEKGAHTPTKPTVLLSYPFEKLKMSSDDGVRMLFLDFGGREGEIVSGCFFKLTFCHTKYNKTCSDRSLVLLVFVIKLKHISLCSVEKIHLQKL